MIHPLFYFSILGIMHHFFDIIITLLTKIEPFLRHFVVHHKDRSYVLLFAIIFIETGLIFFPFLPGDSLLFVVGSIAAGVSSSLNIWIIIPLLIAAALLWDNVNYHVGKLLGSQIRHSSYRFIKPADIEKVELFYTKHGAKALIMARFVPIVRTIAPFVAGLSQMPYMRFLGMGVIGAVAWVTSISMLWYWFGNLPIVQANFDHVVLWVLILSILPMIGETIKSQVRRFQSSR